MGRPKKRPEDVYRTPARSYKPPPELYERFKIAAATNGEDKTAVLIRAITKYVEDFERKQGK